MVRDVVTEVDLEVVALVEVLDVDLDVVFEVDEDVEEVEVVEVEVVDFDPTVY